MIRKLFSRKPQESQVLPYVSIGRKLLKKVKYGNGEITKPIASVAYTIPKFGCVPERYVEADLVKVPFFCIGSQPKYSSNKKQVKTRTIEAIKKQEDSEILSMLEYAVPEKQQIKVENPKKISTEIEKAFIGIEEHNAFVENIVLHPNNKYLFLNSIKMEFFKPTSKRKFKKTSCIGTYMGAKVYSCVRANENRIFFLSDASLVGYVMEKEKIKFTEEKLVIGVHTFAALVTEKIGLVVVNDWAISSIEVSYSK